MHSYFYVFFNKNTSNKTFKNTIFHYFLGQRDAIPQFLKPLSGKPLGEPKISIYKYKCMLCSIVHTRFCYFDRITKSNKFLPKKPKFEKKKWRRRRQPKILIYIILPDLASLHQNTQCFFNKILMKTTFSKSNHADPPKKFAFHL